MKFVSWISAVILIMIYTRVETRFFGDHFSPSSGDEMICDGIAVLSTVLICLFNPWNEK